MTKEAKSNECCLETVLEQPRDGWHVKLRLLDFGADAKESDKAVLRCLRELIDRNGKFK